MPDYENTLKLTPYSPAELSTLAASFVTQVKAAISGQSSTLSMLDSALVANSPAGNKSILALDIGGSKLRLGLFAFAESQLKLNSEVITHELTPHFETLDQYLTELVSHIAAFVKSVNVQSGELELGVAFSFPAKAIANGANIDADRSGHGDGWGKGLIIANSAVNIAQALRAKLEEQGIRINRHVFINDVVALLLSSPGAHVSLVVGTGFNIGIHSSDHYYNTQATYFNDELLSSRLSAPAKLYFKNLAQKLTKEGNIRSQDDARMKSFAEVQISAGYMHYLLANSLAIVGEDNLALLRAITTMGSVVISQILGSDFEKLEQYALCSLSEFKRQRLTEIATLLIVRSSDLTAAMTAGALMYAQSESRKVAGEGSMLKLMPGYLDAVVAKTNAILGAKIEVAFTENATLVGAAQSLLV
jgi:hexokinase